MSFAGGFQQGREGGLPGQQHMAPRYVTTEITSKGSTAESYLDALTLHC